MSRWSRISVSRVEAVKQPITAVSIESSQFVTREYELKSAIPVQDQDQGRVIVRVGKRGRGHEYPATIILTRDELREWCEATLEMVHDTRNRHLPPEGRF